MQACLRLTQCSQVQSALSCTRCVRPWSSLNSFAPFRLESIQAADRTCNSLYLLTGPERAATRSMPRPLLQLAAGLLWFLTDSPAALAGEWIVETHSLTVRSPASIAGTEDAAIGDVSTFCSLDAN